MLYDNALFHTYTLFMPLQIHRIEFLQLEQKDLLNSLGLCWSLVIPDIGLNLIKVFSWENSGSFSRWLWALELHAAHSQGEAWGSELEQAHMCTHRVCIAGLHGRRELQAYMPWENHVLRMESSFPSELPQQVSSALSSEYPPAWRLWAPECCTMPAGCSELPSLSSWPIRLTDAGYHPWSCSPHPTSTQRTSAVSNHKTLGKPKVTPHQEKIGVPPPRELLFKLEMKHGAKWEVTP